MVGSSREIVEGVGVDMLGAQCPAVRICIWRFFNRVLGHLPVAGRWLGESGMNVLHKSFAEKMRQTDRFPGR